MQKSVTRGYVRVAPEGTGYNKLEKRYDLKIPDEIQTLCKAYNGKARKCIQEWQKGIEVRCSLAATDKCSMPT